MLRTVALSLLVAFACLCGNAGAGVPETPRFRVLGVADGVPSSTVTGFARDRAGYLWMATADGLARYDGVSFRVWRHVPGDANALPGNIVQAVHVDAQDRVWVGTESGGLSVLDRDRLHFRHYRKSEHPEIGSDDTVTIASRNGELWFGTWGGGLHRLGADGRITQFVAKPDDPRSLPSDTVVAILFDGEGKLWIATDTGLARWDGSGFERMPLPGSDPAPLVLSLGRAGDALWVGAATGAYRYQPGKGWDTPAWSGMFERPNALKAIEVDANGTLWLGSQRGLWWLGVDGNPAQVAPIAGMQANSVPALLPLANGGVWAPLPGIGIGYLRADWRRLATFARPSKGLSGELYRSIAVGDGGVWLTGNTGVLEHLGDDGQVRRVEATLLEGIKGKSVAEDGAGTLWVGHRLGLLRIDNAGAESGWSVDGSADATLPQSVDALRVAPDGSVWAMSTGGGLQQRDPRSGHVLQSLQADKQTLFATADSETFEIAADGAPWIAGTDGLLRWDAIRRRFESVAAPGLRVQSFDFDGGDTFWLHRLSGLERYRRDGNSWRLMETVGPEQGIPAVESAGLRVDRGHRVWLATPRGLFRWDPATRHLRHFGLQDGLASQEFVERTLTLTPAGVLMGATADGSLVMIDTAMPDAARSAPNLVVDAIDVRRDGQPIRLSSQGGFELKPDDRELRVQARLLAFDDPHANRYESMLAGFDPGWMDLRDSGERVFTVLPAGAYTLRLRAYDPAGNLSNESRLDFRVLPPWWRTTVAMIEFAILGLLLLSALAWAYRRRLRRKQAWQLAQHKRELAEQASEAKTRFLATLGHEVRTPMTGVLGMSELLLGTHLDERQRGYTQSIRSAGEHLLSLVNNALDLARIEAGRLELEQVDFDLRQLIDGVVALMAPMAEMRGLQFTDSIDADAPRTLRGDPMRLRQILLNLLGNAVKFTERGGVSLTVSRLPTGGVRLEVSDTGPGLNEEQRARLFRRFEQGEGARTAARYGGSGLGLAICQELAATMDGRILVDSTPGVGSRFVVELPLPESDDVVDSRPGSAPLATHLPESLRILLVEDDAMVADVIAGLLRLRGHVVTHVVHGLSALTEIALTERATFRFDLAMLDLDLPGMDGLALARQLRAQGFASPLLAVTARADSDAEPQAEAAGFDGFVRKPVTGEMLDAAIRKLRG